MKIVNNKTGQETEMFHDAKFMYVAMTQAALVSIRNGWKKQNFMEFAAEIWNSAKMSDPDHLQHVLAQYCIHDMEQMGG